MARPPGFDRAQVLEAVERQFRKTGYAGTSLDDLCAVTGLGRGSLYAAFGDKHSLFMAAFGGYCERNESILREMLACPDGEALGQLRRFLTDSVGMVFEDREQLGCMVMKFAVELAGEDPAVASRIKQDVRVLHAALTACVEAAQRAGDLDADAPAAEVAGLILTLSRGLDVVSQACGAKEQMATVAERAFASLPLTSKARRRLSPSPA